MAKNWPAEGRLEIFHHLEYSRTAIVRPESYNNLEIVSLSSSQIIPELAYKLNLVLSSSGYDTISRKPFPFPLIKHFPFRLELAPNSAKWGPPGLGCVYCTSPRPPIICLFLRAAPGAVHNMYWPYRSLRYCYTHLFHNQNVPC